MSNNHDEIFNGLRPTILCFDSSNILYRTFYANKDLDDITIAGLAQQQALVTLMKYYKKIKPTQTVMCFDRPNWRAAYTKSGESYTKLPYKGHRRQSMTPSQQEKYLKFLQHLSDFENLIHNYTAIGCMFAPLLEADDLMAGIAQMYHDTHNIVIVSTDQDLMQLLKYPSVTLIDPATGNNRTLEEYGGDAELFLYEKCFRGDHGDNVQSAYPRIRSTKIRQAYTDPYVHTTLMEHVWTDQDGDPRSVKQLFEENKLLMDLSQQPEPIRELITTTVQNAMDNPGKYSHFHFIKFCGQFQLQKIIETAERFVPMLSSR